MDGFDAIVLAGGTAERLGGVAKHAIEVGGRTLLERTLAAAAEAAHVIVVGDDSLKPLVGRATVVREDPPLAGPAAGIGAGLADVTADRVLVLACDYPDAAEAVAPLLTTDFAGDGAIAVDGDGRRQNLLFVARTDALRAAVARQETLTNLAVHRLLEPLDLTEISVPAHALHDVDTWEDLNRDQ
ncbi:MAG: molybdenum cofactor guanylyltransferase [Aeromicrobium sp.]